MEDSLDYQLFERAMMYFAPVDVPEAVAVLGSEKHVVFVDRPVSMGVGEWAISLFIPNHIPVVVFDNNARLELFRWRRVVGFGNHTDADDDQKQNERNTTNQG